MLCVRQAAAVCLYKDHSHMKKTSRFLAALLTVTLLAGCASVPPQPPLQVSQQLLDAKAAKLAVVMSPMPKVDTEFPGAGCLLCMAAASMTNKTLTNYVQTLPSDDLGKLSTDLVKVLRTRGFEATQISEPLDIGRLPDAKPVQLNFARKDFTSLKARYGVDKLLVIDVRALGVTRNYANYFPAGDPRAFVRGTAYIVDLNTNALDWYVPLDTFRTASGKWDEEPSFPGLTNAYFQVVEASRDTLKQPFVQ